MIKNDLERIGIAKGMSIEFHSSMRSIDDITCTPDSIINDLKNIITPEGNIVMPAFPLSKCLPLNEYDLSLGIVKKNKWLDEKHNERTDMGIVADVFCRAPGTLIGTGQHRMAAWGKNATKYVNDLMDFVNDNGYGLLVGVDIRKLTAMHYVENNIPDDIWPKLFMPMNEGIHKIYNQNEYFITTETQPKYHRGWLKVQKLAEDKGLITRGKIGNAVSLFFKVIDVISIYENELINNITKLFDIE